MFCRSVWLTSSPLFAFHGSVFCVVYVSVARVFPSLTEYHNTLSLITMSSKAKKKEFVLRRSSVNFPTCRRSVSVRKQALLDF